MLFRHIEATGNKNWTKFLKSSVFNLNSRKLDSLAGLSPNDLKTRFDDVRVDIRKGGYQSIQPDLNEQKRNEDIYKSDKKKLQVGEYVYVPSLNKKSHYYFGQKYKPGLRSQVVPCPPTPIVVCYIAIIFTASDMLSCDYSSRWY